ncbi:MAG TPA: site-specific DNA-methyltransferase [Bellilinea sp.]|nr:site-specific DNA-methyltransferase [Bellilinea sp.]
MNKLKMQSPNLTQDNIARIRDLFPNCVTEARDENGDLRLAVDFDLLRQELSESIVDGPQERYHLNWPGKREALLTANAPIAKTLRPCREESVDFDTTKNLFIEGDNLDALKLLQETYLGKVKVIYIDPPYNGGRDLVYKDDFYESSDEFLKRSNQTDGNGNRLVANTETSGRFHSDWLSMMYSRLKLARNLLSDDGVVFISIDDDEQANLRKLGDEVFGEGNFIAQLVWDRKKKGTFLSNVITNVKEYILVYCKNRATFPGLIGEINYSQETYPCINASNKRGIRRIPAGIPSKYREKNYSLAKGSVISVTTMDLVLHSDLVIEDGILAQELVIEGNWRYTQDAMSDYATKGELYITQDLYLRRIVTEPRHKTLKDLLPRVGEDEAASHKDINISNLFADGWGSNEDGEEELRQILGQKGLVDFPKPRKLIEKLCVSIRDEQAVVLDFFAGSATTAHAVLHLNAEDGGNRRFIMVQLPEPTKEESVAAQAGYTTIAEIAKERIRRAGKKILEGDCHEDWSKDIGFRVLKVDTSNMMDVYYTPDALDQTSLPGLTSNIKPDRTPEDLLFQVLLDWGIDLSLPIHTVTIQGKEVFFVDDRALVACFDDGVNEDFIKELAKYKPTRAVFRDTGFASDAVKINVEQVFKQLSPGTDVRSI